MTRALKDYAGAKFGCLTAIEMVERGARPENDHIWLFQCECGSLCRVRIKSVRSGHTRSCGCLHKKVLVARNKVHGLSRSWPREYRSWKDMRARCRNQKHKDYKDYGGRGIEVCSRWADFAAFLKDMGPRPDRTTIDRINVERGYDPGNCRWASAKVQANNKRSNRLVEIGGERKTLQQWSDHYGVEPSKVRYRLSVGYSPTEAFSTEDKRLARNVSGHSLR